MAVNTDSQRTRSQRFVQARLKQVASLRDELIPMEPAKMEELRITLRPLDLECPKDSDESQSRFFRAITPEFLESYPVDKDGLDYLLKEIPKFLNLRDLKSTEARENPIRFRASDFPNVKGWTLSEISAWLPKGEELGDLYCLDKLKMEFRHSRHSLEYLSECTHAGLPHLSMLVANMADMPSPEGCLLRHELAYILKGMDIRFSQRIFDKLQPQPIIMASFLAPRHGRILQAHLEDCSQLIIYCSKLYGFIDNETAPFELFARWLLANPTGLEPNLKVAEDTEIEDDQAYERWKETFWPRGMAQSSSSIAHQSKENQKV